MKVHSAEALAANFRSRFPGKGINISASAETKVSSLDLQAAGVGVHNYGTVSGKLRWVKAKDHFYQGGEPILTGELLQVPENDAKQLVRLDRAAYADDAEVAEAQKASKK